MAEVPVATVDATGLHLPTYDEGLTYFQASFRSIYGEDVNLEPSTQDGQFMALLATALKDANDSVAAAYNAFSPSTAQGVGLSSVVKINGLVRKAPSYSTVDLRIVGQAGASLSNGVVSDEQSQRWNLPDLVTIPLSGEITVTAIAADVGARLAKAGTVTLFATIQAGFQSVTNPLDAIPGQAVEQDPELKARQTASTALPSQMMLEGLMGALVALPGVERVRGYENDTSVPDAETGIPAHAISVVVEGGDTATIAALVARKKAPGVGTYGNVVTTMADAYGIPHSIAFFRPIPVQVAFYLTVRAFRGYTSDVDVLVRQALSDWTNGLGIGNRLIITRAYLPANLNGDIAGSTYEILSMSASRDGVPPEAPSDIEVGFNEVLVSVPSDVRITVIV